MDWSETNRDLLEDPEMHRQNNVQNLEAEVKALPQKKRKRVLSIETAKKVHQPKLSELRRQLPLLKKKLAEQSKLLKMREITVLKLKLEIQMKAQHLELTKEMKDEAKNFHTQRGRSHSFESSTPLSNTDSESFAGCYRPSGV